MAPPRLLFSISTGSKTVVFAHCFTQYFFPMLKRDSEIYFYLPHPKTTMKQTYTERLGDFLIGYKSPIITTAPNGIRIK